MSTDATPVDRTSNLWKEWEKWKKEGDFPKVMPAGVQHQEGQLWGAFYEGFERARQIHSTRPAEDSGPSLRQRIDGQLESLVQLMDRVRNLEDMVAPGFFQRPDSPPAPDKPATFEDELGSLINRHSLENESNTPDFLLARYVVKAMALYATALKERERWYGIDLNPGCLKPDTPERHAIILSRAWEEYRAGRSMREGTADAFQRGYEAAIKGEA